VKANFGLTSNNFMLMLWCMSSSPNTRIHASMHTSTHAHSHQNISVYTMSFQDRESWD